MKSVFVYFTYENLRVFGKFFFVRKTKYLLRKVIVKHIFFSLQYKKKKTQQQKVKCLALIVLCKYWDLSLNSGFANNFFFF